MAITVITPKLFYAKQTIVGIGDAVTINTTATLYNNLSTGISMDAIAKNVQVQIPKGDVAIVATMGQDANSIPNAVLEQKNYGEAKISGTLLLDVQAAAASNVEAFFYKNGTYAGPSGYVRYQAGRGTRNALCLVCQVTDGTNYWNVLLNNAIGNLGDAKVNADGHWEIDFEAICLPKDCYLEKKTA